MEVKPGHKQTEVGVIPNDWSVVSAFDACSKIQDGTHFSPRIAGSDYLYVTSKNIRFGHLDISTASWIDSVQHQAIYHRCDVKKGDLLLTKDGANTGNAALNTIEDQFSLLSSVAFLRFNLRKHCAAYFLQQILTSQGQRQIQDAMAGNAITRLTLEKINKLRFPVPPTKAEQRAIAEVLSDADALIESLEQLLTKKRQIKKGAMQELLTGKKRLPGFSGEWEVKRLGEFVSIRNQKALPSGLDVDTLCIEIDHIGQGDGRLFEYSAAQYSTSSKYRFCSGDVLFGRLRSYLRKFWLADRDGICSTEIWPLMVDPEQARSDFLYAIVQSDEFIATANISYGTHMPRADWDIVRNFSASLPKPKEQTAIATILSDMDAEITALEAKLSKARLIKQGMMQELLTGRVRLV